MTEKKSAKTASRKAAARKTAKQPKSDLNPQAGNEETNGKAEPAKKARPPKKPREPKEELVVFAFRLTPEERELIHKAAGAAKASRFVRTLAVAAAKGDRERLEHIFGAPSTLR